MKTQIWIAITVYVLVAIIKKRLELEQSLYTILQILSVTMFDKIDLYQLLSPASYKIEGLQKNQATEFIGFNTRTLVNGFIS